jgi:hypothetical protein
MASSTDPKKAPTDPGCPHLRLVLETGATAQYLTGHYVCDQCGEHFDRPPVKPQKSLKNHEPPQAQ